VDGAQRSMWKFSRSSIGSRNERNDWDGISYCVCGNRRVASFLLSIWLSSDKRRNIYRTRHSHRRHFGLPKHRHWPRLWLEGCFIPAHTGPDLCRLMFHLYGRESGEWKSDCYGGIVALHCFRGFWRNELTSPVTMPRSTGLPGAPAR